ncbi:MAG TPA: LON peptidase substrate-binding domain-containing protein [Pyrinomonadaceae bacterium]
MRELPIFPLPVVLFPGVPMPLHIFEPRYRQLLIDVRVRDNLFGISHLDPNNSEAVAPPPGHVGCVAEVTDVQQLADGRSNILTVGLIRYRLETYVERDDPYLVGEVSFFEDEPEDEEQLARRAGEVTDLFVRIAKAVRTLNEDRAGLPELPEADPERLSFLVAAAMELETDVKQEMLELRLASERLRRLRDLLSRAVSNYEERARVHVIARGNGHTGKRPG